MNNCLSCLYEPNWTRESSVPLAPREGLHPGGHLYYGECRWLEGAKVPPAVEIRRSHILRVGDYLELSWINRFGAVDCPAWREKDRREG